jgi:hypothetical protein
LRKSDTGKPSVQQDLRTNKRSLAQERSLRHLQAVSTSTIQPSPEPHRGRGGADDQMYESDFHAQPKSLEIKMPTGIGLWVSLADSLEKLQVRADKSSAGSQTGPLDQHFRSSAFFAESSCSHDYKLVSTAATCNYAICRCLCVRLQLQCLLFYLLYIEQPVNAHMNLTMHLPLVASLIVQVGSKIYSSGRFQQQMHQDAEEAASSKISGGEQHLQFSLHHSAV